MSNYYKPSGKFSPISFVYLLLVCAIAMPILATIYAYLIWYIPFVYINFLITAGLGFAIGIAVWQIVIKLGKVRNYGLAILLALIAALAAYYFQWVVWTNLVLTSSGEESQLLRLLSDPSYLSQLIGFINENGTWSFKGAVVSGTFLTIIWIIELLIIIGVAIFIAIPHSKHPFNETLDEWFEEVELPAFSYIENASSFKQQAEQGNWEQLEPMIQRSSKEQSHSVFTLFASGNEYYLSVTNEKAKVNNKDKVEFDSDDFIVHLRIDKTVYDMLKSKA